MTGSYSIHSPGSRAGGGRRSGGGRRRGGGRGGERPRGLRLSPYSGSRSGELADCRERTMGERRVGRARGVLVSMWVLVYGRGEMDGMG